MSTFALPNAASAAVVVLEEENGTLTGSFEDTIREIGSFTRTFTFNLPTTGVTAVSATTVRAGENNTPGDLDFTSVLLNGSPLTLTGEAAEYAFGQWQNTSGEQTLVINGYSYGNAGLSGVVTFASGAVPEPGTWAIMILGFAATGFAMRRRKADQTKVAFAF